MSYTPAALLNANRDRHERARVRSLAQAEFALRVLAGVSPRTELHALQLERQLEALQVRVDHPDATITELADMLGVSKDVAWSLIRRACTSARRMGVPA